MQWDRRLYVGYHLLDPQKLTIVSTGVHQGRDPGVTYESREDLKNG